MIDRLYPQRRQFRFCERKPSASGKRPEGPHTCHLRRENAAAQTNFCFGDCGQAACGEVNRQVWAACVGLSETNTKGGKLPHAKAASHTRNSGIAAIAPRSGKLPLRPSDAALKRALAISGADHRSPEHGRVRARGHADADHPLADQGGHGARPAGRGRARGAERRQGRARQ